MAYVRWWRELAACKGVDPSIFIPNINGAYGKHRDEAFLYCATCPVRRACLDEALENGEHGIYGMTSEVERKAIRLGKMTVEEAWASTQPTLPV